MCLQSWPQIQDCCLVFAVTLGVLVAPASGTGVEFRAGGLGYVDWPDFPPSPVSGVCY